MDLDLDQDDYIIYGTPLPEYEDETVLRKKAARELEVRDEKGRQRFHGAFTGGFSAGYFNTVGTKEGWEPSTFISSRSKGAEYVQQNPEDFMDEDDLGEFGIASRKIHTSNKFKDSDTGFKKRKFNELDNVIPGEAPLKELVKPTRDTIGIEILKKLGWRPGKGIGPKIKKQEIGVKVYGCSLPDPSILEDDDPFAQSYTFAPEDVTSTTYKPKDNYFGLGYTGLSKKSVLCIDRDQSNPTSTKSFLKKDKKKLAITGQAFGVGAFEDDDEDIYIKDDMTQYDFSELDVDQPSSNLGTEKLKKTSNGVLEGFCLSTQPSVIKKYYPPPELPSDFIPKFNKLSAENSSTTSKEKIQQHYGMTATERSFLLGEKKFQSFQLKAQPASLEENKLTNKQKYVNLESSLQRTSSSFKPFPNDIAKQKRYEKFLKLKDLGEIDKFVFPSSLTEWERQQELEEFYRSSVLFKPLSGALSSKFESRSHLSVEHEVMDAIEKAKAEKNKKSSSTEKKLVGLKNRQTSDWYPSPLLCKRFNVPNPFPNSTPSGSSVTPQSKSVFDHLITDTIVKESTDKAAELSHKTLEKERPNKITENLSELIGEKVLKSNNEGAESEKNSSENQKPSMDFFKDIFENSSSSEDEEVTSNLPEESSSAVNEAKEVHEQNKKSDDEVPTSSTTKAKNIPKKSGFGVFANLDLDALSKKTYAKKEEESDISNSNNTLKCPQEEASDISNSNNTIKCPQEEASDIDNKLIEEVSVQDNLYGPELPPNFSEVSDAKIDDIQNRRHKLKKHKHKHHKHKSKKKKKKKSSHKDSNDSSDPGEDISPLIILEKFKQLKKTR